MFRGRRTILVSATVSAAMIRVGVTTLKVSTVQQIESKRSFGVTQAALALEDGTFFLGEAFGHRGTVTGEVCFNTVSYTHLTLPTMRTV